MYIFYKYIHILIKQYALVRLDYVYNNRTLIFFLPPTFIFVAIIHMYVSTGFFFISIYIPILIIAKSTLFRYIAIANALVIPKNLLQHNRIHMND